MVSERQRAKKKWFPIFGKGEFDKVKLGESLVHSAKDLIGKQLKVNLMVLTNDPKKQSASLSFKVTSVEGDSGIAEIMGYSMSTSHVRRVVRKAIRRIDDSIIVKSKDDASFIVKPLFITRHRTNKGIASLLRKRAREVLQQAIQNLKSDEVFLQVISNRLQMDLKSDLKKIYPLAVSEIRILARH